MTTRYEVGEEHRRYRVVVRGWRWRDGTVFTQEMYAEECGCAEEEDHDPEGAEVHCNLMSGKAAREEWRLMRERGISVPEHPPISEGTHVWQSLTLASDPEMARRLGEQVVRTMAEQSPVENAPPRPGTEEDAGSEHEDWPTRCLAQWLLNDPWCGRKAWKAVQAAAGDRPGALKKYVGEALFDATGVPQVAWRSRVRKVWEALGKNRGALGGWEGFAGIDWDYLAGALGEKVRGRPEPRYTVADEGEPHPVTGWPVWPVCAEGVRVGRVEETERGYRPVREKGGTDVWHGRQSYFRGAALEDLEWHVENHP